MWPIILAFIKNCRSVAVGHKQLQTYLQLSLCQNQKTPYRGPAAAGDTLAPHAHCDVREQSLDTVSRVVVPLW